MSNLIVYGGNARIRQAVATALREAGHTILATCHTLEGLRTRLDLTRPDLVVATSRSMTDLQRILRTAAIPMVEAPAANPEVSQEDWARCVVSSVGGPGTRPPRMRSDRDRSERVHRYPLIVIGSSTGGPQVLAHLIRGLPATSPPILVAQHMPPERTGRLAERLAELCDLCAHEAHGGEPLKRGQLYVAPGNRHLTVKRSAEGFVTCTQDGPKVNGHRPSVDVLFGSVAELRLSGVLAVLLTGMGNDGAQGMLLLRRSGATTLGQNEASSAVYGMPRVAHELGAVQIQGDPETLRRHVLSHASIEPRLPACCDR